MPAPQVSVSKKPSGKGSLASHPSSWVAKIQPRPEMRGTTAGRPPTSVVFTTSVIMRVPRSERKVWTWPGLASPRSARTARRAEQPVPQGQRSSRPGETTMALIQVLSSPGTLSAKKVKVTSRISGFSGWTTSNCSTAAALIFSPQIDHVAGLVRGHAKTHRGRINDGEEGAAVRNIGGHRADARDLKLGVEAVDETGHVVEGDAFDLAVLAVGCHRHQSRRGVEDEARFGLAHGRQTGLQHHGDDADGVGARHRRIVGGLHDDHADVGFGHGRRQDQVDRHGGAAAGLEKTKAADRIVFCLKVALLVEHGCAGHVENAAGDDAADLPLGVSIDDG